MGYLVIGFMFGVAVSWFWQNQYSGTPVFQQLMKKELVTNGQQGSVATLKKRLDMMEKKLDELESSKVDRAAAPEEKPGSFSEDNNTGPTLTLIDKEGKAARESSKAERRKNCERALLLWREGISVTDIASRTGLGKGEIDLIVSLKNSNHNVGTGSGKA